MKSALYLGYITTPTQKIARDIAAACLQERCIACANIFSGVESLFWWEGKVQKEKECVLFIKTTTHRIQDVLDIVEHLHPYECPAVSFMPIPDGNADFLEWIQKETR